MTDVAVLWIIGLACLIVALLGKAVTVGSVQLPEAAEKRARFGMAIVGVLALVLGVVLIVQPSGSQPTAQPVGTNPGSTPASSPPDQSTGSPMATDSPYTSSPTASTGADSGNSAIFLSDLTPSGNDTPDSGKWSMLGHAYPHSIGYAGSCYQQFTTNYDLNGSYHYFDATVGIDEANQSDTQVEFTIYGNPDGGSIRKLKDVPASWASPASIHVSVSGATQLTLDTNSEEACLDVEFVWGDARLTP